MGQRGDVSPTSYARRPARGGIVWGVYWYAMGTLYSRNQTGAMRACPGKPYEPNSQNLFLFLAKPKPPRAAPWTAKARLCRRNPRLSGTRIATAYKPTTSPLIATQKQAQR